MLDINYQRKDKIQQPKRDLRNFQHKINQIHRLKSPEPGATETFQTTIESPYLGKMRTLKRPDEGLDIKITPLDDQNKIKYLTQKGVKKFRPNKRFSSIN